MTCWISEFGRPVIPNDQHEVRLLGLRGANLAEMTSLGLPVPPGFTITTDVFTYWRVHDKRYPITLKNEVATALATIETQIGARFGDADNPLLVSVRSSPRTSMPGIMDSVLNLGLNDRTVVGLARKSGDERFAYDSYRRFLQGYGQVVLNIEQHHFEELIENRKLEAGAIIDTELSAGDWKEIIASFKALVIAETGQHFPQDPQQQLWGAIDTVFGSWMNVRAITYRRLRDIPESWGTAVNVQAMVFGNRGDDCATGVAFTRNPSTGANEFYGEYLVNAQGEDVLAGIRTPQHLTVAGKNAAESTLPAMEEVMPEVFAKLNRVRRVLEDYYRDMQEIAFTIECDHLWMLQTCTGRRTTEAALKIAVALVDEGLITEKEAVSRVNPSAVEQFLRPNIDYTSLRDVIATGVPASPGAASGRISLSSREAELVAKRGESVILVRIEVDPEDIPGMAAAQGIVTTRGGMTSHAAVVARGIGRPCVSGASAIRLNYQDQTLTAGDRKFRAGDIITIDGFRGHVLAGAAPIIEPRMSGDLASLIAWADQIAGEVGAIVHDTASAQRTAMCGRRAIVMSAVECVLRSPDGMQILLESISATDPAAMRRSLDMISALIRNSIVAFVRETEAEDICVIIGEAISCERRTDLPSLALYGRGSLVLQPGFVFAQHAAVHDAIDHLKDTGCIPRFTIAIANAFHQSDIALFRKWSDKRAQYRDNSSMPQVALAGVLDSPHSVLFHERIFHGVETLLIDLPVVARRLFLLPGEAIETYQDFGNLELGFEAGGAFNDVIRLLDQSLRPNGVNRYTKICGLLTDPCAPEVMQALQKCGVTKFALPASVLPAAIISIAHVIASS